MRRVSRQRRIIVVCLDVSLPDSNGLEVLAIIRQFWPTVAVLMVTGNNSADTMHAATQRGADGYIVKPFNPAALLDGVAQAVRARGH